MREIDRLTTERYGTPSLVLMENAASAVVRVIVAAFSGDVAGKNVLVLCGRGNNGGDGAATARLLAHAGAQVRAILFGSIDDTRGDARTNFEALKSLARDASSTSITGTVRFATCAAEEESQSQFAENLSPPPDIIVDALFGTGLTRPLAGIYEEVVSGVNRLREGAAASPFVISIDIPSGLNSETAAPTGPAIRADITVPMTAPKIANVLPPASHLNGKLIIADIGSPAELISEATTGLFLSEESDARRWLIETRYAPDSYKNTHGHAVIVAGSRGFIGAAALCGNAAMRAGAGLVTVATPASAQPLVASQVMPEVMTTALAETDRGTVSDEAIDYFQKFSERADVIAVGPGLSSEDERTRTFARNVVVKRRTPVVIDADGLNCLSPWSEELRGSDELPIILTPHPGEMLRLLGTTDKAALNDRMSAAREFAMRHEIILVLKGGRSLTAAPDGRVFLNATGNAGLGTAGAGDTLTGVITGFLAQRQAYKTVDSRERVTIFDTVVAAVYISGLAGDLVARELGMRCMVASDIREHLSAAVRLLDPRGEQP
jgi:hydroxyethylthiazole kinase-like uncharacterized protein yjeF